MKSNKRGQRHLAYIGVLLLFTFWWWFIPLVVISVTALGVYITVKLAKSHKAKTLLAQQRAQELYTLQCKAYWEWYYRYYGSDYTAMSGHEFEQHCADLLCANGYTNARVAPGSGDNGVDVLAEKDGVTYAIQTKKYTGAVGNDAVQQAYAGRDMYQCTTGVVMTNSTFSASAVETAAKLGIVLWGLDKLNVW